jgi:KDO2-lipid IV(A) lauroyltransferase
MGKSRSEHPRPRKPRLKRSRLLLLAEYAGLRLFCAGLNMVPIDVNLRTARRLGRLWWRLVKRSRDRALANVRNSFPEADERWVRRVARGSLEHFMMMAAEMLTTPRILRFRNFLRYVHLGDLREALKAMLSGRGLILLTGHLGNWELLGYTLSLLGFHATAVMRRFDNPYVDDYLIGLREVRGLRILDKKAVSHQAMSILARGESLCFIADQDAGRKGVFVDFFGRKASTYKSIALLAREANVPVVVGAALRSGDRFHYEVSIEDTIFPEQFADDPDFLQNVTQRFSTALERAVRRRPEQYLWMHRRWKTRPREERNGKREAAKSAGARGG